MPQIFQLCEDEWIAQRLLEPGTTLYREDATLGQGAEKPRVHPYQDPVRQLQSWALLWAPSQPVRVNGRRTGTGLRVLRDRDEIRLDDRPPVFYSDEELPVVVPFPALEHDAFCTRCQVKLEPGTDTVKCPGQKCGGHYYHAEAGRRDCFHYGPCLICGYEPTPNPAFRWTPREVYP